MLVWVHVILGSCSLPPCPRPRLAYHDVVRVTGAQAGDGGNSGEVPRVRVPVVCHKRQTLYAQRTICLFVDVWHILCSKCVKIGNFTFDGIFVLFIYLFI